VGTCPPEHCRPETKLVTLFDITLLLEEITSTGTIDPTASLRGKYVSEEALEVRHVQNG
jgi:hypothetical protein